MSKVLDAQPAASSPAPVETVGREALPVSSLREQVQALKGEDRTHYDQTGEFPADREPPTPKADPSPADDTATQADPPPDAENGPDAASGIETEPVNESEKAKKSRQRNAARWDEVIEERGKLKAENELLRKQLAEGTAPKTSTAEAPKPADALKKPRLSDYPNTEDGVAEWQDDLEVYFDAKAEQRIDARFNREKTTAQNSEVSKSWDAQVKAARADTKAFKDFEKIANDAPVSAAGLEIIKGHPQGAAILYYLGLPENAEEAKRIFADTDVDGLDYAALGKAQSNAQIKARTLTAVGIAKAEFNAIARALKKAPAPDPKNTINVLPRASSDVTVPPKGTAIGDPVEDAIRRKDTRSYIERMNEQERRAYSSR